MIIDNPMVTGEWGYDTPFTVEPDVECPVCHVGMFYGDELYSLDGDWMCKDCIEELVYRMTPKEWADITGESIAYTEQMVDECMIDALGIETMTIELDY